MSEAESDTEKVETQTCFEAEQLHSATESKVTVAQATTETVTKVKKVATPRQLEAPRLARIKKMEKAAARKAEYAKLIEKVGIEQSGSESSAEYVIKRVRKGKKVTKEMIVTPTPVTPPTTKHTPRDGSSDGDSDQTQSPPQTQQKKKQPRQQNPPPEVFTLNFV